MTDRNRSRHWISGAATTWSALIVLGLTAHDVAGQCAPLKLSAFDGAANGYYGGDVDIDGDVAIVGRASVGGVSIGGGYVYRFNGANWQIEAKLVPSGATTFDGAGSNVAIDGDVAIIGARRDATVETNAGAAYIFRFNGTSWTQEAKLTASDAAGDDFFGRRVDIDGDVAIVTAEGYNGVPTTSTGAVYVFRHASGSTWNEEAKLLPTDIAGGDDFGHGIAIEAGRVVAGAPLDDDNGSNSGSVYVFDYNGTGWDQAAKLTAADGAAGEYFGWAVDIARFSIVVGALNDNDNGSNSGSAYIFSYSLFGGSWSQSAKLMPDDGATGDLFGSSVDIISLPVGYVVAVGAPHNSDWGLESGSAYIFRLFDGAWWQDPKLLDPMGAEKDNLGDAIALGTNTVLVGAPEEDTLGSQAGAALFFDGAGDCNANGVRDCQDITDGTSTDYNGNFVADECETMVYNLTADTVHASLDDAFRAAGWYDELLASLRIFLNEGDVFFLNRPVSVRSMEQISQPAGGLYVLTDGARLETDPAYDSVIRGELRADANADADLRTGLFTLEPAARLVARPGSYLALTATDAQLDGITRIEDTGTLSCSGPLTQSGALSVLAGGRLVANGAFTNVGSSIFNGGELSANAGLSVPAAGSLTMNASEAYITGTTNNAGSWTMLGGLLLAGDVATLGTLELSGGVVYAGGLTVEFGGRLNTSGEIHADVNNEGDVFCLGDTLVVGDYLNETGATTTVQVGTLTIVGNLTNNGTILGNVAPPPTMQKAAGASAAPGDGMSISGDYSAGAATSLLMPDTIWTFGVGGDFDVAIDDSARYDLSLAELHLAGLSGASQSLELMSLDVGATGDGLDRAFTGHFPLGTLRVGPNATTANLVDNHDNALDGQAACEALYVRNLIIHAGAHLNTNGCPVYYDTLQLDGTVDDPLALKQLPRCPADGTGDGAVDITDLLNLLAAWGLCPAPCPFDTNGDGVVNINDLLDLLAAWGPCP